MATLVAARSHRNHHHRRGAVGHREITGAASDSEEARAISGVKIMGTCPLPLALFCMSSAPAALRLPTFVASHMALQRAPLSARLWGWAAAGSNVSATLDSQLVVVTMATRNSTWSLDLPPQPAGTGHTIVLASGQDSITLTDIAFGDVYLCSGQSNMQFSVNDAFNASAEIAASSQFTDIRLATVRLTFCQA